LEEISEIIEEYHAHKDDIFRIIHSRISELYNVQ